jgi:hypothetical protein
MPLTAQAVIDRANDLILDATNTRWSAVELLRWLNDGRRELVTTRPDLYAVVANLTLAAGTKQALPADGDRFLEAIRNMASDGTTPGRAVRPIAREVLDAQFPDWHTEVSGPTRHYTFDERVPKVFYVYPPAVAAAKLEIAYSQEPTEVSAGTSLAQEGPYAAALVDYICYRAFQKDAEFAGNEARAQAHYAVFRNMTGAGDTRDLTASPNTARADADAPASGG